MSRPGKINTYPHTDIHPPQGLNQAAALTGFALLNADASFYIAGPNHTDIAQDLLVNTAAAAIDIAQAEYIFLPEDHNADGLANARIGTAIYPEDSATLIAAAELISNNPIEGAIAISLKGPGVNGQAQVFVKGIHPALLDYLLEQNSEYPLGIDIIVTDRANHIIGIPRSNKFTYTKTTN